MEGNEKTMEWRLRAAIMQTGMDDDMAGRTLKNAMELYRRREELKLDFEQIGLKEIVDGCYAFSWNERLKEKRIERARVRRQLKAKRNRGILVMPIEYAQPYTTALSNIAGKVMSAAREVLV